MDELESDPIPLSALQHAIYCLRQAALIHIERLWEENRVTGLHVACARLGLFGVADLVEFKAGEGGETPFPVEFKRGKPKLHRADEVQLCAQGLCLEEMFGCAVPEGALFYAETKRRVAVPFDAALRALTEATAAQLRDLFATRLTPPAEYRLRKCGACSLIEQCRPKAGARSARAWREWMVSTLLDGADDP